MAHHHHNHHQDQSNLSPRSTVSSTHALDVSMGLLLSASLTSSAAHPTSLHMAESSFPSFPSFPSPAQSPRRPPSSSSASWMKEVDMELMSDWAASLMKDGFFPAEAAPALTPRFVEGLPPNNYAWREATLVWNGLWKRYVLDEVDADTHSNPIGTTMTATATASATVTPDKEEDNNDDGKRDEVGESKTAFQTTYQTTPTSQKQQQTPDRARPWWQPHVVVVGLETAWAQFVESSIVRRTCIRAACIQKLCNSLIFHRSAMDAPTTLALSSCPSTPSVHTVKIVEYRLSHMLPSGASTGMGIGPGVAATWSDLFRAVYNDLPASLSASLASDKRYLQESYEDYRRGLTKRLPFPAAVTGIVHLTAVSQASALVSGSEPINIEAMRALELGRTALVRHTSAVPHYTLLLASHLGDSSYDGKTRELFTDDMYVRWQTSGNGTEMMLQAASTVAESNTILSVMWVEPPEGRSAARGLDPPRRRGGNPAPRRDMVFSFVLPTSPMRDFAALPTARAQTIASLHSNRRVSDELTASRLIADGRREILLAENNPFSTTASAAIAAASRARK